jgi:hypothetical protein
VTIFLLLNLVSLPPADHIVNVNPKMGMPSAHVVEIILEVHLVVAQNVLSVQTVLLTRLAQIKNVWILVQILVVKIPCVE